MKINHLFIVILLFSSRILLGQENFHIECIHEPNEEWEHERAIIGNHEPEAKSRSTNPAIHYVRVNVHYMLRTDGSGNFTETGDNNGTTYNGYIHAKKLIEECNKRQEWNQQMNIPTGNTVPANDKNYFYILDAVYFKRDNNFYTYPAINSSNNFTSLGQKPNNVLNIFLTNNTGNALGSGYASDLNPNSKIKYTENRNFWHGYLNYINTQHPIEWLWHGQCTQIIHELGHLFGLSHTVMYNNGTPCPTSGPNSCDDGCADTPNAWDMYSATGTHPRCGWGDYHALNCTSNLMDYTGGNSLTPCQLNIIHSGMNNGMKSYTACDAVSTDLTLCNMAYPDISYFGKTIEVGTCSSTPITIANEYKEVYFSESVELQNIEIQAGTDFEVFAFEACP